MPARMRDGYCTWFVRLCVCVCLSTFILELQATKRYVNACLQRNKRSKNNVADLAKTAAFWQEKPAPTSTTFCDPAHQLAWCACVFITRLGACLTGSALGGLEQHCPRARSPALQLMLLQVPLACLRTVVSVTRICSSILHGSCCRSCVSQLLARTLQSGTQIMFAPRVCTLVLFIRVSFVLLHLSLQKLSYFTSTFTLLHLIVKTLTIFCSVMYFYV